MAHYTKHFPFRLQELQEVSFKISQLTPAQLDKMADSKGNNPHPHVQSVLMAVFILLGQNEADLWVSEL